MVLDIAWAGDVLENAQQEEFAAVVSVIAP